MLINRSGEAIGKVALFILDEPCLFNDFTMRVRFNETINPEFVLYFFRSIIFQAQVNREKCGLSLPKIFPSQVNELRIIAVDRIQQDIIANKITIALTALQCEPEKIEERRREISSLVDKVLTLSG